MKKVIGKLGKKGKIALIIGLVVVIALGGIFALRGRATRRIMAATAQAVETVTLEKSDLTQSINVSGVVQSSQTTNIYSTLNFPIQEILVAVGDTVEAGDVLAILDTAALENNISQAEITYGGAKDTAAEEKRALGDAVTNAQTALATAKITAERQALAVTNAEKDLQTVRRDALKPFDSTLPNRAINKAKIALDRSKENARTAQADYRTAQFNFDDYRFQNAITDASIALDRRIEARNAAKVDLDKAQADYNDAMYYRTYNSDLERDTAQEAARKVLDAAQKAYDTAVNGVEDAQRALDRAKTDLTRAKDDAVKLTKDKADAASKVQADAQRAYDKAVSDKQRAQKDYNEANAKKVEGAEKLLADAQKQLEAAQVSVKNAENAVKQTEAKPGSAGKQVELQGLTLDELNRQLANGQIIAEASGVITAMSAKVGAIPQGVLFIIDNKDDLYVSARVKEYSLNSIFIGQEALITTEATDEKKFSATISYISPRAVSEAGSTSVEFEVRATLADPDEAIKIGMNAFLNIIEETKENVYAVPISAVVTNEKGNFIYVAPDVTPKSKPKDAPERIEIPVTLGVKTSTNVEITGAGLKDGLQILTDPENKLSEAQDFPIGIMGRAGRGR